MKNPAANVSVIFGEATKRAKRSVGLSNTNVLAGVVHPNLNEQGALTSKVFTFTLFKQHYRFGKQIVTNGCKIYLIASKHKT